MIFSFIGCMLCLCIMAASVGGVLLSMYIVQVTADDAETLDLDNQKNKQTSIIYDRYSDEYDQLTRGENRIWRELSAMPDNLKPFANGMNYGIQSLFCATCHTMEAMERYASAHIAGEELMRRGAQ